MNAQDLQYIQAVYQIASEVIDGLYTTPVFEPSIEAIQAGELSGKIAHKVFVLNNGKGKQPVVSEIIERKYPGDPLNKLRNEMGIAISLSDIARVRGYSTGVVVCTNEPIGNGYVADTDKTIPISACNLCTAVDYEMAAVLQKAFIAEDLNERSYTMDAFLKESINTLKKESQNRSPIVKEAMASLYTQCEAWAAKIKQLGSENGSRQVGKSKGRQLVVNVSKNQGATVWNA